MSAKAVKLGGVWWTALDQSKPPYSWIEVYQLWGWERDIPPHWSRSNDDWVDKRILHPKLRAAIGTSLPPVPRLRRPRTP